MQSASRYWNWKVSGLALGLIFLATVAVVKPIGVSTQFVIFDAVIADLFMPDLIEENPAAASGYSSTNAYLNKSGGSYAKAAANPINYGFVFVIAMIVGGVIGARVTKKGNDVEATPQIPKFHSQQFGQTPWQRYSLAFAGGVLVLWGARLAGGCTSGHMMSGMMQTSLSGYLFALAAFAAAIPTAILLYRTKS